MEDFATGPGRHGDVVPVGGGRHRCIKAHYLRHADENVLCRNGREWVAPAHAAVGAVAADNRQSSVGTIWNVLVVQ